MLFDMLVGVVMTLCLAMEAHLDRIIANCASFRFALHTLRSQGLQPLELHLVMQMTTVMYVSLTWWPLVGLQCVREVVTGAPAGESHDGLGFFHQILLSLMNLPICSNPDHMLKHYFSDKKPTA